MKKLILLFIPFVISACCFSQLPTQYVYVDQNCIAMVPDFTEMVTITDNCGITTLSQIPPVGDPITETTFVTLRAMDQMGNGQEMNFELVLLDTIAPLMQINPDWQGYSDEEVGDMYKVFYGWVQDKGDEWNREAVGDSVEIVLPDTTFYYIQDSMKIFQATIPILDYRMDEGYWATTTLDLSAMFNLK